MDLLSLLPLLADSVLRVQKRLDLRALPTLSKRKDYKRVLSYVKLRVGIGL